MQVTMFRTSSSWLLPMRKAKFCSIGGKGAAFNVSPQGLSTIFQVKDHLDKASPAAILYMIIKHSSRKEV